jgi:LPS-assembly lipoprotein
VLQLPSERAGADAILEVRSEQREKIVAGLNAAGQVREFQLRLRLRFRLITPQGRELIPETEIALQREIGFAESAALAKEAEEVMLFRDMRDDMLQQIQRRLAAVTTVQSGTTPLER